MVERAELERYLGDALAVGQFKDYGPNGLQVEGRPQVRKLMVGVTASRQVIEAAVTWGADALLVHHGLFWRGQDGRVVGWLRERLRLLLAHDINLLAYHLPLDAHAQWGNNATLGEKLGWQADARFGEQNLGFLGSIESPVDAETLTGHVQATLGRPVHLLPGDGRLIRRVAWCTGGAQGYFESAVASGADVFVTGEMSEPQFHLARETGVAFLAAGHHATERGGVQALGKHLAEQFDLDCRFHDEANPA
ncbi:Nif3-like dinuclear metal center hexameric protein [Inhella gelatinilytica]|uniref:Nif3-like dinuclear metal center hexameric protein n=1 Tax=Inhella gelatinilytica TaxID=2795030 RepID=A0A931J0R9_9BURK|nr:Nif3-like dinuclear metal center hexameric protein [Inhella gelatinilytica]MBH9553261.1 Nif3-like dinuclear metal center hexameric protein [Inhella gelatinilytica]